MNCKKVLLLVLLLLLSLSGCNQSETNHYDLDGFLIVSAYVDEIIPAVESAKFALDQWARDITDPEPLSWLKVDAEIINEINLRHLTEDFPSFEEMESWTVPVERFDQKWVVEGGDMTPAVKAITESSALIVVTLDQLLEKEEITEKDFRLLADIINDANETVKTLRQIFYNQS